MFDSNKYILYYNFLFKILIWLIQNILKNNNCYNKFKTSKWKEETKDKHYIEDIMN
jgi:hypothetical protein